MLDLAEDPGLRAAVAAARAWGVSPSRWAGRPVVERTTYEYDEAGRLTSAVTVRDPDWMDDDRDLAFSLLSWEAQSCPGCGGNLTETGAPEAEDAYEVSATLCHRCVAIEQKQHQHRDHPHAGALAMATRLRRPEPDHAGEG
jgi:hypothetical protein